MVIESHSVIGPNIFKITTSHTTKYIHNYNYLKQLLEVCSFDTEKNDTLRKKFIYDSIGRISEIKTITFNTAMIKFTNKSAYYKYDKNNRVSEIIRLKYDGSKDYDYKTSFKYNDKNLVVEKRIDEYNNIASVDKDKPYEKYIYNYDKYNNVTEELKYFGNETLSDEHLTGKQVYIYNK